ncbi:hypothetical protein N7493_009665 [Penicillium malachiteum]|uniref:Uncharacterized protein n=1 Tax=Penicillium malachiteum TaxID=1324776 RepID=A0AAD6HEJ7_9EURO|nr:hypothetical protein N7493_009665 [Penicillium malachiteum]
MAAMLNLRIESLEDDDPWIIEQKNFNILNDFLQPDSKISSKEAAYQINEFTPMKREARGEKDVEHPESYLFEVWCFFIEISKQIPHDHPSQDKLVSLIKNLKSLPSIGVQIWGPKESMLWGDLPLIKAAWAEDWQEPHYSVDYKYFDEDFRRGVNWHAFSARLLQSGLTDWYFYATRILRMALEDEPHQKKGIAEYRICAAAQWIAHSRQAIFQRLDTKFSDGDLNQMGEGPLCKAWKCKKGKKSKKGKQGKKGKKVKKSKIGISRKRWNFWKATFQAFGDERSEEVSDKTASVCRMAAEQMMGIKATPGPSHE